MKKIIVLPLDERPCNYNFNYLMALETNYEIIRPPLNILGDKKKPGNINKINQWLKEVSQDAYGAIIAVDILVYGGIVPSRLHYDDVSTLKARLETLKEIKRQNKDIKLFAYNLLMRNPAYSSSEEEPDYYETEGRNIHLFGVYQHKIEIGEITDTEKESYEKIKKTINYDNLNDYLTRREKNIEINKEFLQYVKKEIIDFAIIPQDDSSPYGLTAKDQQTIRKQISTLGIQLKCYMYPDADAVTNSLLSRMIMSDNNLTPKVYLRYSSVNAGSIIPQYEDRYLEETLKYHILTAGGMITASEDNADVILLVNSPSTNMMGAYNQHIKTIYYDAFRTLIEHVEYANYAINVLEKPVVIADVAYGNGGDIEFFNLLNQKDLLYKVSSYAGWNTSSNTLGTAIPYGFINLIYPNRDSRFDFLSLRYVEDIGYCSVVRQKIISELKEPYHRFYLDGKKGKIVSDIKKGLDDFIKEELNNEEREIIIKDIYSPWNRTFEVGLTVKYREKK
ncbi:MAG: DUF4127 family protein [Acholeplasmatales bacterium]|nr:DUF4127 family protein [Acholeplasmataceae bacterium]MDY0114991.1 DUF4127 family protein [Acholeplasmatales bacterium]MCK9233769.1 DUF4127 family protein [Acholeplasmataceae bacterium]MCK9288992.1 DUF4127 family protein [Acholeplasmataceae bacterium]MCK9427871.1 DUF4127 family protein [Acholeplasmataceae bacterium]